MSQHLDAEWALAPFLENGLLNKVLSRQSSGKEATVYCCEAGPALGAGRLVAAKIYRSPERRAFKQHVDYSNGRYVRGRAARKALKTRNSFGRQMLFENGWHLSTKLWEGSTARASLCRSPWHFPAATCSWNSWEAIGPRPHNFDR